MGQSLWEANSRTNSQDMFWLSETSINKVYYFIPESGLGVRKDSEGCDRGLLKKLSQNSPGQNVWGHTNLRSGYSIIRMGVKYVSFE
jgi:hypothetical protein